MGVYPVSWILARRLCLVVVVACSVCCVVFCGHIPWLCVCAGVCDLCLSACARACVGVRVCGFPFLFFLACSACLSFLVFCFFCFFLVCLSCKKIKMYKCLVVFLFLSPWVVSRRAVSAPLLCKLFVLLSFFLSFFLSFCCVCSPCFRALSAH